MNSTSPVRAADLAFMLFDGAVVPLAKSRRSEPRPAFFPLARDPESASYFEAPTLAAMGPADFAFPGDGEPDRLIDALAALWLDEGETGLAALAPRLKEIAKALRAEAAETDGEVDILCYTMF